MGTTINGFHIIGIGVRTTNQNGQAGTDLPALWNRFIREAIAAKIPNKISDAVYCIYTDYEKDHTLPYTAILGCKVADLDIVPDGMTGITIAGASYEKFTASGNLAQGIVFKEWEKIWASGLPRTFTADLEVYDARAQNPESAIVDIFIAVR